MADKKSKPSAAVGIDINGGYIRLAEVIESGTGFNLESFSVIEIPAATGSEAKSAQNVRSLKEVYSSLPPGKKKTFALISGSDVIIRRSTIPKMKGSELYEAIKWHIKSHVPFPIENAVIDYKIPGEVVTDTPGAEGIKFYILGPPREKELTFLKIDTK